MNPCNPTLTGSKLIPFGIICPSQLTVNPCNPTLTASKLIPFGIICPSQLTLNPCIPTLTACKLIPFGINCASQLTVNSCHLALMTGKYHILQHCIICPYSIICSGCMLIFLMPFTTSFNLSIMCFHIDLYCMFEAFHHFF